MIDSAIILAVSVTSQDSQLTGQRPSALLPALGKPMVVRVMERLYRVGIRRYVVIVGLDEGAIAMYLNKQWMPDAKVEFELKSNETLAETLARAARRLNTSFMLASYNAFTYERFAETLTRYHDEHPEHLVLTGAQLTLSPKADNYYAVTDKQAILQINKERASKELVLMEYAVCGTRFLDYLQGLHKGNAPQGRSFFDIVTDYLKREDALAMIGETSWILRVEHDGDLITLNKRLLEDSNDSHILSEMPYSVKIIPPVRIDPQVSIGQGAVIGPHVYLERGCSVGYEAVLRNSIVLERGNVPAKTTIDGVIVTTRGIIRPQS